MIKVNDNEVIKWAAGSQPINRAYDGDDLIFPGISGSAPALPAGFVFNFNARDYDPQTRTIPAENGALETNAFILGADPVAYNGDSLTIDSSRGSRKKMIAQISSGKVQYYSIDGTNNRAATWIFKYSRSGDGRGGDNCHFLSNRDTDYNWMVRPYSEMITLHDFNERNQCPVSTYPCTAVIRIADDGTTTIQNLTDDTACTPYMFEYGRTNATPTFFSGYYSDRGEWYKGMFFWCFFANRYLTDAEVTQVINYNEN